mmetsp:Transcript_39590/g.125072  ORF Transcript_39590/g.125072 Transcript_39590/m.125072 type:complete len:831 (-) Transcript_39590:123-2615(-)
MSVASTPGSSSSLLSTICCRTPEIRSPKERSVPEPFPRPPIAWVVHASRRSKSGSRIDSSATTIVLSAMAEREAEPPFALAACSNSWRLRASTPLTPSFSSRTLRLVAGSSSSSLPKEQMSSRNARMMVMREWEEERRDASPKCHLSTSSMLIWSQRSRRTSSRQQSTAARIIGGAGSFASEWCFRFFCSRRCNSASIASLMGGGRSRGGRAGAASPSAAAGAEKNASSTGSRPASARSRLVARSSCSGDAYACTSDGDAPPASATAAAGREAPSSTSAKAADLKEGTLMPLVCAIERTVSMSSASRTASSDCLVSSSASWVTSFSIAFAREPESWCRRRTAATLSGTPRACTSNATARLAASGAVVIARCVRRSRSEASRARCDTSSGGGGVSSSSGGTSRRQRPRIRSRICRSVDAVETPHFSSEMPHRSHAAPMSGTTCLQSSTAARSRSCGGKSSVVGRQRVSVTTRRASSSIQTGSSTGGSGGSNDAAAAAAAASAAASDSSSPNSRMRAATGATRSCNPFLLRPAGSFGSEMPCRTAEACKSKGPPFALAISTATAIVFSPTSAPAPRRACSPDEPAATPASMAARRSASSRSAAWMRSSLGSSKTADADDGTDSSSGGASPASRHAERLCESSAAPAAASSPAAACSARAASATETRWRCCSALTAGRSSFTAHCLLSASQSVRPSSTNAARVRSARSRADLRPDPRWPMVTPCRTHAAGMLRPGSPSSSAAIATVAIAVSEREEEPPPAVATCSRSCMFESTAAVAGSASSTAAAGGRSQPMRRASLMVASHAPADWRIPWRAASSAQPTSPSARKSRAARS